MLHGGNPIEHRPVGARSTPRSAPTPQLTCVARPRETIADGLAPGTREEDNADGWQVDYARFVVAVGDVEVEVDRVCADTQAGDASVYVVDLTQVPA